MASNAECILVPVDFSTHSRAALVFAAGLSKRLKVPLTVLHVVHDPSEAPGYYDKIRKKKGVRLRSIEDKAGEAMKTFITGLRNEREDLKAALDKAETKLVVGLPVSRILEVVTKTRPHMVIMGSQGRTGLAHLYLGSKAEQVTRLCPVPVTIVKSATS